jgi:hypothetical protein
MRVALLSSALLVLGLSFPQGEGQQPKPPKPPAPVPTPQVGSKAATQALLDDMQGGWRLKLFDSPTLNKARRQEVGYMIVAGKCFSFEMHMMFSSPNNDPHLRTTVTGTHTFELDESSHMTTRQLIGSANDNTGLIIWEEPGRVRKFEVTCTANMLQLRREDGTVYEFERMAEDKQLRDIYGRPLKVKDPNAPPPEPVPPKDGKEPKEPK